MHADYLIRHTGHDFFKKDQSLSYFLFYSIDCHKSFLLITFIYENVDPDLTDYSYSSSLIRV